MNRNITDQWTEMSKSYLKPLLAINELNAKTFTKVAKGNHVDSLLNAKNAEDIFEAQSRYLAEVNSATMSYMQELTSIMLETSNLMSKQFNTGFSDLSHMGSESIKAGQSSARASASEKERR